MPKKSRLTFKILCFLISIDLLETVAQFCFKKSALGHVQLEISSFLGAIQFVQAVIPSVYLWVGLFSVIIIFITWSTVLSRVDLSVAVPVCSFSYVTVPLVSALAFHLFGRHVIGSPHGSAEVGIGYPVSAFGQGQAKIHDNRLACAGEDDVFGLEVTVDYTVFVAVGQSIGDL